MRTLPTYDYEDSDGCSLAPFLPVRFRVAFQRKAVEIVARGEAPAAAMIAACRVHDLHYYYGGTKAQRKEADKLLVFMWTAAGAPRWFRELGYQSIRIWGGPLGRIAGVSWGYGGSFFQYGDRAIALEEIAPSEQAQAPKPPLYGHDLWPFNEERCNCDDDVVCSVLTLNGKPYGMVCQGCGKEYTECIL